MKLNKWKEIETNILPARTPFSLLLLLRTHINLKNIRQYDFYV
jgi:hypothetical protein